MNLNHKKILIIDDIVTTGITACSIMIAILSVYPYATVNVFALAWTPTQNQQAYLKEKMSPRFQVHDPEIVYERRKKILDEDFEKGKTNISLF